MAIGSGPPPIDGLAGAAGGDGDTAANMQRRAVVSLARALSRVENTADPTSVVDLFPPVPPDTRVVGITGSPGAGKSTLVAGLVTAWCASGRRVAVLAIDPSSATSGGALLGDRIRMQSLADDHGVFVRSVANRGHLGGLSARLPVMVRALAYAGFDDIVVETVGVGQSETDVRQAVDSVAVVLCPGQGDSIQAAKAGVLEVADVYIVNKADLPGAADVVRDLKAAILYHAVKAPEAWSPMVVSTVAWTGAIDDAVTALDRHAIWLRSAGALGHRRRGAVLGELRGILTAKAASLIAEAITPGLVDQVDAGAMTRGEALRVATAALAEALARP